MSLQRVFGSKSVDGSTGNVSIAAAAAGKTHHLHGWILHGTAGTASGARFEDGSGGTALTGVMDLSTATAGDGVQVSVMPVSERIPIASCTTNTALNLEITGAIAGVVIFSTTTD